MVTIPMSLERLANSNVKLSFVKSLIFSVESEGIIDVYAQDVESSRYWWGAIRVSFVFLPGGNRFERYSATQVGHNLSDTDAVSFLLRAYPHRQALQVIIPQAKCKSAR